MSDVETARQALTALIRNHDHTQTRLHHIITAWEAIDRREQVKIGERFPRLAEAIVRAATHE